MFKKAAQRGRSERGPEAYRVEGTLRAHGATNKERQVCARRRVGEAAGSVIPGFASEARTKLETFFNILLWSGAERLTGGCLVRFGEGLHLRDFDAELHPLEVQIEGTLPGG